MKKPAITDKLCQPQVAIQLPLPLLSRLKAVKEGFFDLCIRVGEQALQALMEAGRPFYRRFSNIRVNSVRVGEIC